MIGSIRNAWVRRGATLAACFTIAPVLVLMAIVHGAWTELSREWRTDIWPGIVHGWRGPAT